MPLLRTTQIADTFFVHHPRRQFDIRPSPRHIRRYGYVTAFLARILLALMPVPRHSHNLRFAGVVLGIEHFVYHPCRARQQLRQSFVALYACCSHQHRPARFVYRHDLVYDRFPFLFNRPVDHIFVIHPIHRPMRRQRHRLQLIDIMKLFAFRHCRTGHPRQFAVQPEQVLQRYRRQRLIFLLDRHPFFRFYRLMQSFRPLPAFHQPTGEFIYYRHLIILHYVVLFLFIYLVCPQRRIDSMYPVSLRRLAERARPDLFFSHSLTFFAHLCRVTFPFDHHVLFQPDQFRLFFVHPSRIVFELQQSRCCWPACVRDIRHIPLTFFDSPVL